MPFADANSQLEPLLFQMKQYKNLTKSTIEILPSSGQTNYGPNMKAIFTLPYASMISLEDLAFHFTFEPTDLGKTPAGSIAHRVIPPRDVASLISEIDIKINGQTIQHLTNYNDIVNLLNLFEEAKTAKKVLQGCDPANIKAKDEKGKYVALKDQDTTTKEYSPSIYYSKAAPNNAPKNYVINHWYGLLGHRGDEVSSNFIDTNMLGEVTIAFTFASACVCANIKAVQADLVGGYGNAGDTQTHINDAVTATNTSYKLSNLKMSMVRYNLPMQYSEALASNLSGGAKYQIAFNHYEIHSQKAEASKGLIRWNENSRDVKGLLAYFTNTTRADSIKPTAYDKVVDTSGYFKYDNPIHNDSQFQIGSVKMPQNKLNSTDAFLELTRGVPGARGNNVEFFKKITSVEQWLESYFMAYLSLEMTEGMTHLANGNKKLLSGLSSENLPISCSYEYNNDTAFQGTAGAGGYAWNKNVNVMSLTTRLLVIENGQNCYVEI